MYSCKNTLQNYLTSHGVVSEGAKKICSVIFSCHMTSANTKNILIFLFLFWYFIKQHNRFSAQTLKTPLGKDRCYIFHSSLNVSII